ncbi:hypothetical protein CONLIGDRAFT_251504 [Coniochaeta ligniaria NRRL 30616]|uniref:Uncharacterized protein n=1 Tax=Coniochaeta ligniaria NRRL 30616 TaxID=1408157 RepID=A0A1J7IXP8_9PEZI|nr:hypothetical protein CONLIGDRAFT_251504 [Coniochaeta ligniaria NRRL 30616]
MASTATATRRWTADNGVHWLRDLLPHDVPRARIFCWGYDANTHAGSHVSCQYLYDHARSLISDLCLERKLSNSMERPIIFVAHSLGGIVVKSALIHSDAARRGALEEHRSIKVSTYGIIFLGTPHQGGNGIQLGKLLVNIVSVFVAADDRILKHLERDSEWLQQQLGQYSPISGDFVTKFAFEEYKTPTAFGSIMVVPRVSAVVPGQANAEPIAIHADHANMVRYTKREDSGYKTISGHLTIMANDAVEEIRQNWEAERRTNEARSNASGLTFTIGFSLFGVSEVDNFVAREEELTQLHDILGKGRDRRTAIIHGLGGMGKTQLAVAYAKRHRDDYSAVFWLNSRDETSLKQGFVRVAERILREHPSLIYIKNAVESHDLDRTAQAVKQWLDDPKNNRWLVICDNYDHPLTDRDKNNTQNGRQDQEDETNEEANTTAHDYEIRPFLPDACHGAILITTRSSRVKLGQRIPLRKLGRPKDSLEILSYTSGRQNLDKGISSTWIGQSISLNYCIDIDATELVRVLDGLPLALSAAGAYLDNMAITVGEYLRLYKESWSRLQKTTPGLSAYDKALYSTWDISYARVEHHNPISAQLLHLWAYFDHEDLWFELLQKCPLSNPPWFQDLTCDELAFNEAVRVLCDYGLVDADTSSRERGAESSGYSMHSCVHMWTRYVLNKLRNAEMTFESVRLAMRCVASRVTEDTEREYWVLQRRLLRHGARCFEMMTDEVSIAEGEGWALLYLGRLFSDQGRLNEARAMYEWALQCNEKALGPDNKWTLATVTNLGNVFHKQGRLQDAETMHDRALKGYTKALGPDHVSTFGSLSNLGNLYAEQGRLDMAEDIYNRALQGATKVLEPEHELTLCVVHNLGSLCGRQGRLEEAETMCGQALQGYEKSVGLDHTSTLDTVSELGGLYRLQGKLQEAEAMYNRALEGYTKALGPDHNVTLDVVHNLGILYSGQRKLKEAETMFERALEGYTKALGPDHTSTLDVVYSLGILYSCQRQFKEAETMYDRALEGYTKALGPSHISTFRTVNGLAALYFSQGRLDEAKAFYERAMQGYEDALESGQTSALKMVESLNSVDIRDDRLVDKAVALYERVLQGCEKALGPEQVVQAHLPVLSLMDDLAFFYDRQGRVSEATAMYVRCQAGYKSVFGVQHDHYRRVTRALEKIDAGAGT